MGVMNTQRISTFIAGFVLVLVALVVIFNLVNSRTGRAVMAARDNRIAAESVGISVTKYKMIAFVVSAALAGAAGTLYGCSQTTFAATKFDFNTSILILVFVVLGGLGNMWAVSYTHLDVYKRQRECWVRVRTSFPSTSTRPPVTS